MKVAGYGGSIKELRNYTLIEGELYMRLPGGILSRCVELKKIMTPRPKEITQQANPMTSNHKMSEFTTKKKDGKPKRLEAQNPRKEKLSLLGSGD